MKTRLTILVLFIATAALAADDPLKPLSGFIGTYKCTGMSYASEMGPEHATTATVTVKTAVGGKWLETHYSEAKTAKTPQMDFNGHWGWDDGQKKFVSVNVDSMGGYGVQTATSSSDGAVTFEGVAHMGPASMNSRDVFTVKGNTAMHTGYFQDKAGAWKKMDEETCKK